MSGTCDPSAPARRFVDIAAELTRPVSRDVSRFGRNSRAPDCPGLLSVCRVEGTQTEYQRLADETSVAIVETFEKMRETEPKKTRDSKRRSLSCNRSRIVRNSAYLLISSRRSR